MKLKLLPHLLNYLTGLRKRLEDQQHPDQHVFQAKERGVLHEQHGRGQTRHRVETHQQHCPGGRGQRGVQSQGPGRGLIRLFRSGNVQTGKK